MFILRLIITIIIYYNIFDSVDYNPSLIEFLNLCVVTAIYFSLSSLNYNLKELKSE